MKSAQQIIDDQIEIRDQSGEPYAMVWNWLLDRSDLSGPEKLVWIALKSYSGCPEIRPNVQTVARRASVSIRTTQRSFFTLSQKKLLRVERRSRPDGGFAANRYILLKSPHPLPKTETKGNRHSVTCPPGDIVAPTQVPQRHHKENTKQIKNTTTTPLRTGCGDNAACGEPADENGRRIFIDNALYGTILSAANSAAIARAAQKYRLGNDEVATVIHELDLQYRTSQHTIGNPTSLVTAVLKERATLPGNYAPEAWRNAEAAKRQELVRKKAEQKQRAREAEDKAYKEAEAKLSALSQEKREALFEKARAKVPVVIKNSQRTIRMFAIEMLISQARAPGASEVRQESTCNL
jgi:hypothetical protein